MIRTHSRIAAIAIVSALLFALLPMTVFADSSSEPAAIPSAQSVHAASTAASVGNASSMGKSNTVSAKSSASTHYYDWKQNDPRWSSIKIGSKTMGENGSAVTSLAMLLVKSGLKNESTFNPGIFANDLKSVGAFNGDEIDWNAPTKLVPQFKYCGETTVSCHPGYGWNSLAEYYDDGYYIVVSPVNREYWMAVEKVSTGYMSSTATRSYASVLDPGTEHYTYLDSEVGTVKVKLYTAPNPCYWKGDSPTSEPAFPSDIDSYKVPYSHALSVGSSGREVKYLQYCLMCLGYAYNVPYGGEAADSSYGRITEMAVRNFQYNHGITVTGVCDYATWAAIEKAVGEIPVKSGKCGDNITYTLYDDGLLELNGSGAMYDYQTTDRGNYCDAPWFHNPHESESPIKKVSIQGKITSIGDYSFYLCRNLTNINISNSVTSIKQFAFCGCYSLTNIVIPNSVTSIGSGAFDYCSSLTSVTIPDSVTSIGSATFSGCDSLKDIYYSGTKSQWEKLKPDSFGLGKNVTVHFGKTDKIPATGITLSKTSLNLKKGDSATLTATVTPSGSTDSVSWTSSNTSVATVSNGVVTAVAKGSATITATAGGKKATCTVTVNSKDQSKLAIIEHPKNIKTLPGRLVTFSVKATGEGLSYQWYYKKSNASDWSVWRIYTEPTINPPANNTWNGMQVYCKVTDKKGKSVSSNPATVTILEPKTSDFMIISHPVSVTLNEGDTATFRITAKGSGLTYQWYYIDKDDSAWIKWKGHNQASTSAVVDKSWNGRQVYCVVTDNKGESLYSDIATVTIAPKIKITQQPENKTVKLGDKVTLSLKAEGIGLSYQWYYKKASQSSFKKWNGHTQASETVKPNETWNGIQFYCIVKDSKGKSVQSDTVKIKVTQDLKITVQPENKTVKLGDKVTLTLKAEGTGLSYQWYYKKASQSSFKKWNGRTNALETFKPDEKWNKAQFYCQVKDSSGKTAKSSIVKLTVKKPEFKITQQPKSQTVAKGTSFTVSVKATGSSLKYQWYYKKKGAKSWTKWTNQTNASVTFNPDEKWNGAQFYCKVKDSSGKTLNSSAAKLTVTNPD